jgi:hypothetical protein
MCCEDVYQAAYIVCSIRIGASIQEQPNHLKMTILNGVDEGIVHVL